MTDDYFGWLKSIVLPAPNGHYTKLLSRLFLEPFDPKNDYPLRYKTIAEYDDNRAADGIYLRYEYYGEDFFGEPCSMLEMLIALANRFDGCVGFDISDTRDARMNFWMLIHNLGLDSCTDKYYNEKKVDDILMTFKTRTYDFDGNGGLFPLKRSKIDQRKVEIWSQMQAWEVENFGV